MARSVDRRDWNGILNLSAPDSFYDYGAYKGDATGLITWMSDRHKNVLRSSHVIGGVIVEFATADTALSESYVASSQRNVDPQRPDVHFDILGYARYIDRFERENGIWTLKVRQLVFDNLLRLPVSPDDPVLGPGWQGGQRDETDLLWKQRLSLGIT